MFMVSLAPYPGESKAHALGRVILPLCGHGIFVIVPISLVSILPALAHSFAQQGATPANARFMAQMIAMVAGLASIVGAPSVGLVTRRFGKRNSLLVLLFIYAVSGGVGVFEPGFAMLIAARIISGFSGAAIGALTLALIADYYHGALRFTLLGLSVTIQMLLAVISILLCGALAGRFGWGAAFYVFFFIGLAALVIAWAFIIEPQAEPAPLHVQKISWGAAFAPVWPIYLIVLVVSLGQMCTNFQGPFLLNLFGVTKPSVQALYGALPIFAAMIAGLFFGWIHRRVQERRIIITVSLVLGLGVVTLGVSRGPGEAAGLYTLVGLAGGIFFPASIAMVVDRALLGAREASVGLILGTVGLAQFLNPVVARPLTGAFGVRGAFVGMGTGVLIMVAILILGPFARNPPSPEHEDRA
jgi:predicted MFS family arabinose efflux permease